MNVIVACEPEGLSQDNSVSLIKVGRGKTVKIGRRPLVLYASLEPLLTSDAEVVL